MVGVVAFGVARGVQELAYTSQLSATTIGRAGGVLLVGAGLYQLTPIKDLCLRACRTPFSFVLHHWRPGWIGAVRMGLRHGLVCLGCCWPLFALLIPLGVMNVGAMLAITALVLAEKTLRDGERIARAAAVVLIAYGIVVVAVPSSFPTSLA